MKDLKPYLASIKASPFFSYIETEEDLLWLLRCCEAEITGTETAPDYTGSDFEDRGGFYYFRLPEERLLLRMKAMRAGKLCSFQCKFHRDFLDRIAAYESGQNW